MPGAHSRVADFQFQNLFGGIKLLQCLYPVSRSQLLSGQCLRLGMKRGCAGLDQRSKRFCEDQTDEVGRRVIAAGGFAGEYIRTDEELAALGDEFVF